MATPHSSDVEQNEPGVTLNRQDGSAVNKPDVSEQPAEHLFTGDRSKARKKWLTNALLHFVVVVVGSLYILNLFNQLQFEFPAFQELSTSSKIRTIMLGFFAFSGFLWPVKLQTLKLTADKLIILKGKLLSLMKTETKEIPYADIDVIEIKLSSFTSAMLKTVLDDPDITPEILPRKLVQVVVTFHDRPRRTRYAVELIDTSSISDPLEFTAALIGRTNGTVRIMTSDNRPRILTYNEAERFHEILNRNISHQSTV